MLQRGTQPVNMAQDNTDDDETAFGGKKQLRRREHLPTSQLLPLRCCWLSVREKFDTVLLFVTVWGQGDRQLCNINGMLIRLDDLMLLTGLCRHLTLRQQEMFSDEMLAAALERMPCLQVHPPAATWCLRSALCCDTVHDRLFRSLAAELETSAVAAKCTSCVTGPLVIVSGTENL